MYHDKMFNQKRLPNENEFLDTSVSKKHLGLFRVHALKNRKFINSYLFGICTYTISLNGGAGHLPG